MQAPVAVDAHQRRLVEVLLPDDDGLLVARHQHLHAHATVLVQVVEVRDDLPRPPSTAGDPAHHGSHDDHPRDGGDADARVDEMTASPAAELIAVSPRGHLGTQRGADAHELQPFAQPGQSDVVGGRAQTRLGEQALALLDRLPALLERGEVPPLAGPAHDPEPPLRRVERKATPYWEMLNDLVLAEVRVAEKAG